MLNIVHANHDCQLNGIHDKMHKNVHFHLLLLNSILHYLPVPTLPKQFLSATNFICIKLVTVLQNSDNEIRSLSTVSGHKKAIISFSVITCITEIQTVKIINRRISISSIKMTICVGFSPNVIGCGKHTFSAFSEIRLL